MQFLNGHGGKYGLFAPVVLHIDLHGCKLWVSAPVVVHWCRPELRQEPALLRVLRNSPRAMPLFGAPHRPIAFSSHTSLRKRLRDYVLTGLLLFGKTERPEIYTTGESIDSQPVS